MTITTEKLEKAFNELVKEIGDNEIWEYIGYRLYPTRENCEIFEITISCSVPDRNVSIGGIKLKGLSYEFLPSFLSYIMPQEIKTSDWSVEFDEEMTPKELLKEAIRYIYDEIEEVIDFEKFVNSWLEELVNKIS